jgi:hypothetical protein
VEAIGFSGVVWEDDGSAWRKLVLFGIVVEVQGRFERSVPLDSQIEGFRERDGRLLWSSRVNKTGGMHSQKCWDCFIFVLNLEAPPLLQI